ncbi:MAG: hypothetical protein H6502_00655 [Candidatus Woesearchaeota archaeon]|nr:MAG: hypothetical protein H6502_00655 [Candidatus Woesearchaeota archaeon]
MNMKQMITTTLLGGALATTALAQTASNDFDTTTGQYTQRAGITVGPISANGMTTQDNETLAGHIAYKLFEDTSKVIDTSSLWLRAVNDSEDQTRTIGLDFSVGDTYVAPLWMNFDTDGVLESQGPVAVGSERIGLRTLDWAVGDFYTHSDRDHAPQAFITVRDDNLGIGATLKDTDFRFGLGLTSGNIGSLFYTKTDETGAWSASNITSQNPGGLVGPLGPTLISKILGGYELDETATHLTPTGKKSNDGWSLKTSISGDGTDITSELLEVGYNTGKGLTFSLGATHDNDARETTGIGSLTYGGKFLGAQVYGELQANTDGKAQLFVSLSK